VGKESSVRPLASEKGAAGRDLIAFALKRSDVGEEEGAGKEAIQEIDPRVEQTAPEKKERNSSDSFGGGGGTFGKGGGFCCFREKGPGCWCGGSEKGGNCLR